MTNEILQRYAIPFESVQLAGQAVDKKGEFDAAGTMSFPHIKTSQPLFGADPKAPSAWTALIRVFSTDVGQLFQLYVLAENTPEQGASRYSNAALPGGRALPVEHLNSDYHEDGRRGDYSFWSQHLTIDLSREVLTAHLTAPLRVQISRPNEGLAFVVEIPAYYIAAVLYRFEPDDFDVLPASAEHRQQTEMTHERQRVLRLLKQSAWFGAAAGAVMLFFADFEIALAAAAMGCMVGFNVLNKRESSRAPGRHYLRSPSD
jgi:hypothetical protein